jgi:hypothetical protein
VSDKFTPGPWHVYPPGHEVPHYDVCRRVVADVSTGRTVDMDPSDADAQLIAAAPELLNVVRALLWSDLSSAQALLELHDMAQRALLIATGEPVDHDEEPTTRMLPVRARGAR